MTSERKLAPWRQDDVQMASDAQLLQWLKPGWNSTVHAIVRKEAERRGLI